MMQTVLWSSLRKAWMNGPAFLFDGGDMTCYEVPECLFLAGSSEKRVLTVFTIKCWSCQIFL
jgi:hypothetical protein